MLAVLALSFCPFLTPVVAIENELLFAPKKGSSLRKRFEESSKWRLAELTQVINGSPIAVEGADMSGVTTRRIVVLDLYEELGEGKPKRLLRAFEELAGEHAFEFDIQGATDSFEMSLVSPLADTKVVFARADEGERASAKFAEGSSGDTRLLDGLTEDLDLRAFLPDDDVGPEDWWDVDSSDLSRVLAPGGVRLTLPNGGLPASEVLDPVELASTVLCVLSENTEALSGDVTATWKETTKHGDDDAAMIAIEWKSRSQTTLDERLNEVLKASGATTKRTAAAMSLAVACDGEGALDWNLSAKRANAFDLALKTEFSAELFWTENGQRIGYRFRFEGESKLTAEFEAP